MAETSNKPTAMIARLIFVNLTLAGRNRFILRGESFASVRNQAWCGPQARFWLEWERHHTFRKPLSDEALTHTASILIGIYADLSWICWILSARKPETRSHRIERTRTENASSLLFGSAASTVEIIALARRDAPGGSRRDRQIFAGEFENRLLGPDHPSIFPTFEDQVHISAVEQVASCRFRHRRNLRCGSPHNCQACGFTSGAGSLPADSSSILKRCVRSPEERYALKNRPQFHLVSN